MMTKEQFIEKIEAHKLQVIDKVTSDTWRNKYHPDDQGEKGGTR